MIVPSMNTQQRQEEYLLGYINLNRKIGSFINKLRRQVKGNSHKHCYYSYTDPQKNTWGTHLLVGKKQYTLIAFLLYNHPEKGKCAMTMDTQAGVLYSYTGHFFKRYNERLQLGFINTIESMQHFFLHAIQISVKKTQDNRCHLELPNGVGFGCCYSDGWMEFKTFITDDMLKGKQKEFSELLQKDLDIGKFQIENYKPQIKLAS